MRRPHLFFGNHTDASAIREFVNPVEPSLGTSFVRFVDDSEAFAVRRADMNAPVPFFWIVDQFRYRLENLVR